MTSEEREKLNQLCQQIQSETDHAKLTLLLQGLNELLERREQLFREDQRNDPLL